MAEWVSRKLEYESQTELGLNLVFIFNENWDWKDNGRYLFPSPLCTVQQFKNFFIDSYRKYTPDKCEISLNFFTLTALALFPYFCFNFYSLMFSLCSLKTSDYHIFTNTLHVAFLLFYYNVWHCNSLWIYPRFLKAPLICMSISFLRFGKVWTIMSSNNHSIPFSSRFTVEFP